MTSDELHPSVRRILDAHGADLLDTLSAELSAPDLTSLLLAVAHRRVDTRTAADVMAQYQRDRFVAPSTVPSRALREVTTIATRVASGFEEIELAPLAPFGVHSVLGGVSQNRVVSTSRGSEAAADPTNVLALEAALRRRASNEETRLCAVQRVSRAQITSGPLAFAHFSIFGLVTAGRDDGDHRFERTAMLSHIRHHASIAAELGLRDVRVAVSDLSGERQQPRDWIVAHLRENGLTAESWPDREAGIGYYPSLCFKVFVTDGAGTEFDVADGGITPWTQALLENRKERLMISGAGLDRLASASPVVDV